MSDPLSVRSLRNLVSETRNPRTTDVDLLPVPEVVGRINAEDKMVASAVEAELPVIATAVEVIADAFRAGGRLIYIGAGTSGRLGVLDASECPPTFSVPPSMVIGIIAGGDRALRHAVEGAEDSEAQGADDLAAVSLTELDVVVGIAVSGRTPYVIGALDYASEVGARTMALTCNPNSLLSRHAEISIAPVVGPEVVTGSTRLKSGTAQKMVLNMLTTAAMIRLGKTYQNLMVDLSISNSKLQTRAVGILSEITGVEPEEATVLLAEAGNDVKLAICMKLTGLNRDAASKVLAENGGVLRKAIDKTRGTICARLTD
ncbi:MAG: N-acetylmuramic acid 6-phosphate etherase [Roseibium album]|uniref:N-acetylmuramic acid 6-phosphate etherase n=1 Tax=Roseibium album TaxID=311410 RepID=A0A0M6ZKG2_9HYPH|nr:N-acetylmuramic acid 6-phosphate etherase [Roseibium album]MBG6155835.1 N-acetylmuramic acid 6-phosphate etherase [Labrenzia sp. EL_162]MBG6194369.1 N-acetylmuramic acid 6-phosphate etherase [Labrenzia sp. EL_159]CTQ62626.1 N-acetylmuramic acid 6-phosphate etherase [Roseibium album]CTQ75864.1 N-acetylmuramic acid 6-phosphate etherase [Roseibium album]CTQ78019.1 N-acetylmuramic acid 6-phosphate etherase [Roseibium album]